VTEARWDAVANHWIVRTGDGQTFEAQSLVSATGQLSRPLRPSLPGLENFAGTMFHSAEWRHDVDLTGKNVAVIGTGASAIQFVPAIAPLVGKLTVFQRSAAYVVPKPDKIYSERAKSLVQALPRPAAAFPPAHYIQRELTGLAFVTWRTGMNFKRWWFFRFLERSIVDENLRERLTPDYRMGCKRILLSNDFYPAMMRPNVELVTEGITEIRKDSIVTADGVEHKAGLHYFRHRICGHGIPDADENHRRARH